MLCKTFDLLRNWHSTVSAYADERQLLVLTALLTSPNIKIRYGTTIADLLYFFFGMITPGRVNISSTAHKNRLNTQYWAHSIGTDTNSSR